jgi:thiol:disulfide interchange protein
MMNKSFLLAALAVMLVATSEAFSSAFVGRQQQQHRLVSSRTSSLQMAVKDIDSESAFDDTIKSAGKSLVVVDYSTTWCGPVSQVKRNT